MWVGGWGWGYDYGERISTGKRCNIIDYANMMGDSGGMISR